MATAFLPANFNQQFLDTDGSPLNGGLLYTYAAGGPSTPQVTYKDDARVATNTNPIVLDANGEYSMYLDPALVYYFKLTRADGTQINTWDNISATASATGIVTSVNGETGVVALDASDIPFTTGTSTTWFNGTDVGAALDGIITHVDSGVPAASVSVDDAGGYFTGTNVETALQEIGARNSHGALLRITPFVNNGTWTKGDDVSFIVVEGVGGGGGSSTTPGGGGGGGGGGYFKSIISAPNATEAVTIGLGGPAGSDGNTTYFGTWCTAAGGKGSTGTDGGNGGTATGGTLNLQGSGGGAGGNTSANAQFGFGGSSFFGGGAAGGWNRSYGVAGAPNTGGGGSGGTSGGAVGGSGLVIVYEYS